MSRRSQINRWIQIEGFGDALTNRLYRLCESAVPALLDPHGVYLPIVMSGSFGPIDATIDFRSSGESRATIGGLSINVIADAVALGLLKTGKPSSLGFVTVAVTESSAFVTVDQDSDTTDYSAQMALWGREAVYIYSRTGPGPYTYACMRGQLGTVATAHDVDAGADPYLFQAGELARHSLRAREVVYGHTPPGGGYDQEVIKRRLIYKGGALGVSSGDAATMISMVIDSALSAVTSRKLCEGAWEGARGEAFDFGEDDPYFQVNYAGPGATISHPALYSIGDATALTLDGVTSDDNAVAQIAYPEALTAHLPGSPTYSYDEHGDEETIYEMWSSSPAAPNVRNTGTPTKDHLSTNGPTLIRQLLTSTNTGNNGDYDLGTGQLGAGLQERWINADSFDTAALSASLLAFDAEHFGEGGDRPTVGARCQRIAQACGMVMVDGADGRLVLQPMRFISDGTETVIEHVDIIRVTRQEPRDEDPAGEVLVRWDSRVGPGTRERTYDDAAQQERLFGLAASMDLDLSGLSDAEAAQARGLQDLLLWRGQLLEVDLEVILTEEIEALSAGDPVWMVSPWLLTRDGEFGQLGDLYQVLSVTSDTSEARAFLTLLYTGGASLKTGLYAPSALVGSTDGLTVTIGPNAFSQALLPGQVDDTFGFSTDSIVQIESRDGGTVRGTAKIMDITGLVFTLDAMPGGVVSGDVIELAGPGSSVTDTNQYMYLGNGYDWV